VRIDNQPMPASAASATGVLTKIHVRRDRTDSLVSGGTLAFYAKRAFAVESQLALFARRRTASSRRRIRRSSMRRELRKVDPVLTEVVYEDNLQIRLLDLMSSFLSIVPGAGCRGFLPRGQRLPPSSSLSTTSGRTPMAGWSTMRRALRPRRDERDDPSRQ
jgi:hypothetical protein